MSRTTKQLWQEATRCVLCAALLLFACHIAAAQSTDLTSPTPVFGGEISGRVVPLDVGDARLTRHFYTFNARPGDLELTIETNNLEGDVDLYTAAAMRPLAKVTLYAGLNSTVARTIFFRRDETLVLRVQARSSNDTDGTYRIRLGGTFAPSTMSVPDESARATESASAPSREKPADRNTRRVNSVGARIEEPRTEVAIEPTVTTRDETARTTSEPAPTKPATAKTPTAKGRTARREPARRGATQRSTTGPSPASSEGAKVEPSRSETAEPSAPNTETTRTEPARTNARTNRSRSGRTRAPRTGATGTATRAETNTPPTSSESAAPSSAEPASPATTALGLEAPGSRLVLELRGGERIVREMSEVRRVAIEGRLIVIVLKNGRIERQPLANVSRMTIEP